METLIQYSVVLLHSLACKRPFRQSVKYSGRVIFLTPTICIKSSPFTTLAEAHAMIFIKEHTSVPVPKVYMAFERKGRVYIVMERINGTMLACGWVHRSAASQAKILKDLKTMVEEWRRIPSPKGVGVANIDGGPIYDVRLPTESFWGPFDSVDKFHSRLRNGIDIEHLSESSPKGLLELAEFHAKASSVATTFTHGDLSSLNILCRGDQIVGIIDWETAGWFPSYWEYTTAWHVNPHNEFWQKEVDSFVEPWPEALEMEQIRRKYFGDF
ncbi:uncharacterized protein RCC_06385 [Ramularia collo-cygni]|uniref:Aminoglycoside phosphotransferase domain-containing protein n=1 Tax=Ramularia collo-cygni TaxID=112498 RepID=A0A2D3V1C0_9PEZI|nr:uncharacterized protein RCC_06385 [Ramularia collo-cygni]CZT20525.1 uncharacterized protein RCC_06385 [Ramularia collo-cygni]